VPKISVKLCVLGTGAAEFVDEVGHYGDVDEEDENFAGGEVVIEGVELKGDERRRDDNGEIFGPAFAEGEADTFGKEQAGID